MMQGLPLSWLTRSRPVGLEIFFIVENLPYRYFSSFKINKKNVMSLKQSYRKLIFMLIALSFGCQQDALEPANAVKTDLPTRTTTSTFYLERLKEMGFDTNDIQEFPTHFIVEKHVLIEKYDLDRDGNSSHGHRQSTYKINAAKAANIKYFIDSSINADYVPLVIQAVQMIDKVSTSLNFTRIMSGTPDITFYSDEGANCPFAYKYLDMLTPALGGFPNSSGDVPPVFSINLDNVCVLSYPSHSANVVGSIAHELGHCIGLHHTNETSGTPIQETPSVDDYSIMNFQYCDGPWPSALSAFDRVAIAELYRDGTVSSGTTSDLDAYIGLYGWALPPWESANNVVAVAIASNDYTYTWYTDGTVAAGYTSCADAHITKTNFSLPPGKTLSQIVEIGIASNDRCYTWFSDGTVSIGTSIDLDYYGSPVSYTLAPGKTPADVVGIDIASDDHCYVWYSNGTASSGTSVDLDYYIAPYSYTVAPGKSVSNIIATAIASDNHSYVWYKQ
jgi:hypothetical protein